MKKSSYQHRFWHFIVFYFQIKCINRKWPHYRLIKNFKFFSSILRVNDDLQKGIHFFDAHRWLPIVDRWSLIIDRWLSFVRLHFNSGNSTKWLLEEERQRRCNTRLMLWIYRLICSAHFRIVEIVQNGRILSEFLSTFSKNVYFCSYIASGGEQKKTRTWQIAAMFLLASR